MPSQAPSAAPSVMPSDSPSSSPTELVYRISSFTLVRIDTGADIDVLSDGYVINRNILTMGLNMRVDTIPYQVDGVDFYTNGNYYWREFYNPYSLGANACTQSCTAANSNYFDTAVLASPGGILTIRAIPWKYATDDMDSKTFGVASEVKVLIIEATAAPSESPSKNPSESPSNAPSQVPTAKPVPTPKPIVAGSHQGTPL